MTSAYFLQDYGAIGLTYACIISMVCRILLSVRIFYYNYPWMSYIYILPSVNIYTSYIFVYCFLQLISMYIDGIKLIAIGGIIFSGHMYFIYIENKELISLIKSYKHTN